MIDSQHYVNYNNNANFNVLSLTIGNNTYILYRDVDKKRETPKNGGSEKYIYLRRVF